jgi:hypothetical protein
MHAVHTLPAFLLPRLSWQAPVRVSRALKNTTAPATLLPSYAPRPWQDSQEAGIHTSPRSFRCEHARHEQHSILLRNPELRRSFHATARRARDHHFDTLKFVQRLQGEGFTEEQAAAMMKVLNDVIEERYVPPPHALLVRAGVTTPPYRRNS